MTKMQTQIENFLFTEDQFRYITRGLDKRKRQYKILKLEFAVNKILFKAKQIKPKLTLQHINDFDFFYKEVDDYYSWIAYEKQWEYYNGPSQGAILSYIRHTYTNYDYFLSILNQTRQFSFNDDTYYLLRYQDYYYNKFRTEINNLILEQFKDFFNWFEEKYD